MLFAKNLNSLTRLGFIWKVLVTSFITKDQNSVTRPGNPQTIGLLFWKHQYLRKNYIDNF